MKQEVEKWRPFGHPDGDIRDLSFLDAHQAVYVQHHEGKEPLEYRFWVTYSLHCFTKDYEHQTNEEKQSLMYHAPKESRPFCQDLDGGDKAFYFVAFRAFREKKKLRLHVTSAYPISEKQKGKSVKFFTIAYNLLRNKQLPQPSK